ncbi:MAG: DUF2157 domain-containing protein [Patescibacteria group bacterium]
MQTKEEILSAMRELAAKEGISQEELVRVNSPAVMEKKDVSLTRKLTAAEILYYLGGTVIFLGIAIMLAQSWSDLSVSVRILSTLGSGAIAYGLGFLLSRTEKNEALGSAFHLISALVLPMGLYVAFEAGGYADSKWLMSVIAAILFGVHLLSYYVFRKGIFSLFSIIFGTLLFFKFTDFLLGDAAYRSEWEFVQYRLFFSGAVYMLLGYLFSGKALASFSGFLYGFGYGFGVFGFLSAALSLGGWKPEQNLFWEIAFPFLVFGVFFTSVHVKSKAFLVFGTLSLMLYVLKITAEYFSDSLGWALTLVLAGLLLIAVGYLSVYLKRKYFL